MRGNTAGHLDDTTYAILAVFHREDQPLWEELIYERLKEHQDDLPINGGVTIPVVERRVKTLHDDEYLERVIASPDPLAQKMVSAYIMMEKAERLFQ